MNNFETYLFLAKVIDSCETYEQIRTTQDWIHRLDLESLYLISADILIECRQRDLIEGR